MALLAFAGVAGAKKPRTADTVFKNGYVYTVNPGQRTAHAVAVRNGKIIYVGSNQGAPRVHRQEDQGRRPQGQDAHAELLGRARPPVGRGQLPLRSQPVRPRAARPRTRRRSASSSPPTRRSTSYQGSGWSEAAYPGIGPLKADLDGLTTKPMALWSDGHHSLWVNQAALDLAGIDNTTPRTPSAA